MPTANWITNGFGKSAQKLGFENLHLHCLRHYYASTLIALGIPDRYIMERLGHSTPDMLRTVYGHIISDRDREFGNRISSHLSTIAPCATKCTTPK
jgi:integrase